MIAFAKRNAPHIAAVVAVLALQVLVGNVTALYYRTALRPALVRSGARPCANYKPLVPKESPSSCDLVLVRREPPIVQEVFEVADGSVQTVVVTRDGAWHSTESSFRASQAALVLPFTAFCLYAVALAYRMVRTQEWFGFGVWNVSRYPLNRVEELLLLYAVPVFLSGLLVPFLRS